MSAMKDLETQKRGVVGIAYNVGPECVKDRQAVWRNAKICSVLPMRFAAMHYCYDDPSVRMLLSLAMFVFERSIRFRCRTHFGAWDFLRTLGALSCLLDNLLTHFPNTTHIGTHMECAYKLMTFGIPSEILPVSPAGEKRLQRHLEWLEIRRRQESSSASTNHIIVPGPSDLLLGRGKPLQVSTI